MMLRLLFWISLAGLFYIYAGYPLLVGLLSMLFSRPVRKAPCTCRFSVVMSVYNESSHLPCKIDGLLSSQANDRLKEIIVASDGSTDSTAEIAHTWKDPRIRYLDFKQRRGKAAVINDVIPLCASDLIVLTDARQDIDPQAFDALISNFADDTVGVVSGELVFQQDCHASPTAQGASDYWSFEKNIRRCESLWASVPGATGALYALRKAAYRPIPSLTILDDVAIPMLVVEQGYRCVFEESARAYDYPSVSSHQEMMRKRRTLAGILQLCLLYPRWLLPWVNPIWFQFVSHKIGRMFSPFLLGLLLLVSLRLAATAPFYRVVVALQLVFYGIAGLGGLLRRMHTRVRLIAWPWAFLVLNGAAGLAWFDALTGRWQGMWDKK